MKNRALPKLMACDFVEIRQMKLSPPKPKLLWMHLKGLPPFDYGAWEYYESVQAGMKPIGAIPNVTYPYK